MIGQRVNEDHCGADPGKGMVQIFVGMQSMVISTVSVMAIEI